MDGQILQNKKVFLILMPFNLIEMRNDSSCISSESLKYKKKLFQVIRQLISYFDSSKIMISDLFADQSINPLHPIQDFKTQ